MKLFQDTERNGTIGFNGKCFCIYDFIHKFSLLTEFSRLWQYIADWQRVFKHFDRDHSGTIERRELADALRNFGYNLSPTLLSLLEHKYGNLRGRLPFDQIDSCYSPPASSATAAYGPIPGISFDRFVRACVAIKTLTEAFQRFTLIPS